MIISWLTGGLGNQMFQYAAGLALAHSRRTVLKLDVSWFREDPAFESHNRYALDCMNITGQFATSAEIAEIRGIPLTRIERWSVKVARHLRFYQYANRYSGKGNLHSPPIFGFYPEFHSQPDHTYLEGMFQSEQFFAQISDVLRLHFTFRYPPQPAVVQMGEIIKSGPSAAVHFRRGDYARNSVFKTEFGVLGMGYYERAISVLRERHPELTLYIFSDDIEAVAAEFRPDMPHVFVKAVEHWHAYDRMRLISMCDHAIISNSTFCWWGAWLNPSKGKTVIAPEPWFANSSRDTQDVVPRGWIRISTNG